MIGWMFSNEETGNIRASLANPRSLQSSQKGSANKGNVIFLGLLDTFPPGYKRQAKLVDRVKIHFNNLQDKKLPEVLQYAGSSARRFSTRIWDQARLNPKMIRRYEKMEQTNEVKTLLRTSYKPEPYAERVTLFAAAHRPWYMRWDPLESWGKYLDIERVRPIPELSQLAEHWFSPEEQAGLSTLPSSIRTEAFYHIWTQKEAFIKAHGEGLGLPLKDFSVSVDPAKPGKLMSFIINRTDESFHWHMASYNSEKGWRAAMCVRMEADPEIRWIKPEKTDSDEINLSDYLTNIV